MSRRASRREVPPADPGDAAVAAPVTPVASTAPAAQPAPAAPPAPAEPTPEPVPDGPARPSRRRRALRRVLMGAVAIGVLAVVGAVGVLAAPFAASIYAEFGYHPAEDAQAWAARPLVFATASTCGSCHDEQRADVSASEHAGVSCASCHGALAAHVEDENDPALLNPKPEAADCLACHAQTLGRPVLIAQVVPATHFASGVCVTCHDAHNTTVSDPPDIGHAIAGLPACITCHGAEGNGIKPWPDDHVDAPDTTCLTCHTPATITRTNP